MEYRIPKQGEIYRHFKGNLYEIVIIARDSETLEEKVVYKEVDGDAAYVRPLKMFVSYVDKQKYPDADQEFRFELVKKTVQKQAEPKEIKEEKMPDQEMIMEFLDLSTAQQKIQYLQGVKDRITDNFISVVAHSLDFAENAGDLYERYMAIMRYLRTVEKYESGRLR